MKKSVFVFAFILVLVACFQNCAPSNFTTAPSTAGAVSNPSSSAAFISGFLTDAVCQKLASCTTGLDSTHCAAQVNALQGLPQKFGVTQSGVLTMLDVVNLERSRSLVGSGAYSLECTSALQNLSCSDAGVAGAYDPATGSYSGVPQLIGEIASCGQVY